MSAYNSIHKFSFPTNIQFGPGAIANLPEYLLQNNVQRPLLVTDPNVADLEFFAKIKWHLEQKGLSVQVFSNIHKNPVKSDVLAGGENYRDNDRDGIVGIGGGAGMDVARAIALRINHNRDLFDYDDLQGGDKYVTNPIPPFVTVPTTSGTGSEVGRSAIISEDDTGKKRILFHPTLMAQMVFADPELTYELPAAITAATGMDALTHNIEAYLAKGFHPMADGIALQGIQLISESIDNATNRPDPESRSKMMLASLMGAVAFQKGLGIVHSLAHPLSTLLDMHHGLANAVMLTYGMKFNVEGFEDRFLSIGSALGLKDHQPEDVLSHLRLLIQKLRIPQKLSELEVKEEHIEHLSDLAYADFCHPNNPKPVSRADFKKIYQQAIL